MATIMDTKEKILFTPGPLSTAAVVKQAMLTDLGSRDEEFAALVKSINDRLLALGKCSSKNYASVIIPGSGTYGVESVISSVVGPHDRLLILENGAYGKRLQAIAEANKLNFLVESVHEDQFFDEQMIEEIIRNDSFTHIAMIHCETTTGILNQIKIFGNLAKRYQASFIVDAMSSFGGIPINVPDYNIDFLISSSNKCIEGVPGFSFVLANIAALKNSEGKSRSLSLDLLAQFRGFLNDGLFRFTPPTHVVLAFNKALDLLDIEGGIGKRAERYQENQKLLMKKMHEMGFSCFIDPEKQSSIITSFKYPEHKNFDFEQFYKRLKSKGFVIYPGKVSNASCFRIGTIGHIFSQDIDNLTNAIKQVLADMAIACPLA